MPVAWTEISLRVILSVTSSHYLEMSTCALALFFFWFLDFSLLFVFFFLAMDCCFSSMNKE